MWPSNSPFFFFFFFYRLSSTSHGTKGGGRRAKMREGAFKMSREHLLLLFPLPATKPAETQYFCRLVILSKYFKTFFWKTNSSSASLNKFFNKKKQDCWFFSCTKSPRGSSLTLKGKGREEERGVLCTWCRRSSNLFLPPPHTRKWASRGPIPTQYVYSRDT